MVLVLDTSILISLEKRRKDIIKKIKEISSVHQEPAVITFISYFEFLFGIKDKNLKNEEKAIAFLNKFGVLKINRETARISADLKYKYNKKGFELSLSDLLIASQAIENNMTLVTTDKDFEQIEELKKIII